MVSLASPIAKVRDGEGEREIRVPIVGKAVIYLRVSRGKQADGASLEVQLQSCRRFCWANGLEIVGEYWDVQSGLDSDRQQYQQVLDLARAKAFDKLVVFRYDRSGRDDTAYFLMLKGFTRLGVSLVSASGESPDPFSQKLAGLMAWDESRRISIRVTGSKMKRFEDGKWNGKPLLGYAIHQLKCDPGDCDICREHGKGGCILVPNAQAPLVTEMFQRYASGRHSLSDLRDLLNEAGVLRSRHGIQYTLTNKVYLGMIPHGKNPTSQFMPTPELTWSKGQHQALIDPETFDKVQARLAENQHRQRGGPRPAYLFSGMVYCGRCGRKYVGRYKSKGERRWNQYQCGRQHSMGDCPGRNVYESRIKDVVITPLKRLLAKLSQTDIREALKQEMAEQRQAILRGAEQANEDIGVKLARLEARLTKLEDTYLDGLIEKDRYISRRTAILAELEQIRGQMPAPTPPVALPDLDAIFAIAQGLTIEDWGDPEWRQVVEETVSKIVIEAADTGEKKKTVIRVVWKWPEMESLLATAQV